MQVDDGDHYLMTKEELANKIATFTGGRAAEELIFHSITTGASNDIEQATKLARAMISRYGMSEDFDMVAMENVTNQYLGGVTHVLSLLNSVRRFFTSNNFSAMVSSS
jgi:cell division protease FtsH